MASIVMPSVAAGTQHICRAEVSSCSIGGNSRPCCSRSSAWTLDAFGRSVFGLSSPPQSRVLRLSTRAQSDPQFSVPDANLGAEPQIILPNVNTPDYLYGEKQLSKAVDEDNEDSSEDEEDQDDPWLLEFQNEVERIKQTWSDVESMKDSWNHVSDYSGLPRNTTRRRVLGAPMFMSLAFVFGWAAPARNA